MKNGAHDTFIIAVRCRKSKYFMRGADFDGYERNARCSLALSHFKTPSTLVRAQWQRELCKNCEWRDFSF
jgi:hypothetical protein